VWHAGPDSPSVLRLVGDPSIADALLDRLLHRAVRIELKGESLRKRPPRGGSELT
jgi:DNA replication protein DnaC